MTKFRACLIFLSFLCDVGTSRPDWCSHRENGDSNVRSVLIPAAGAFGFTG